MIDNYTEIPGDRIPGQNMEELQKELADMHKRMKK